MNTAVNPNHKTPLLCNRLLLGITGSISVLLMPYNIFVLRQQYVREIQIIASHSVEKFLTPYALQLCSGQHVFTDSFQSSSDINVPHIQLTTDIDLFLIMPATANILAKAAHGICDNLITTAVVACKAPVVFVPSMNEAMWTSPIVQQNVTTLKTLGHHVIPPSKGYEIATMEPIIGTMPPIESILLTLCEILQATPA